MRIGSLFSGVGGLDMAVQDVFGGRHAWFSEIDPAASKVLAHRFPHVPNLGDITKIDWQTVEPVDVLCGGFPCQDVSAAGKRAGIKSGTRSGLWSVFADAIDALRPQWVVVENVRGLLSATAERAVESGEDAVGDGAGRPVLRAAGAVLGDLADIGYDAQWATIAAADVGAPHRRERVFIVATDAAISSGAGLQQQDLSALRQQRGDRRPGQSGVCACGGAACGCDAPHPSRDGWDQRRPESARLAGGFDAAVSGDEPGVALLPTPSTHDKTGARSPESIARMSKPFANLNDTVVNELLLNGVAVDVGECVDGHNACLPVELAGTKPEPGVAHGAESRFGGGNGDVSNLWQIAHLLPTPRNRDGKGATSSRSGDNKHDLPSALAAAPDDDDGSNQELWPVIRNAIGYEYGRQLSNGMTPMFADDIDLDGLANAATVALQDLPGPLRAQGKADSTGKPPESGPGSPPLLRTPASADGQRGQDFARANREGSGGDDLVTLAVKADRDCAWGKYAPAIARWEQVTGQPAPPPTEPNKTGNPRLSAAFSEWLMGWPPGWVTDPAIGISRNDQLRCVGNGVVSLQAAAAIRYLLAVATDTHTPGRADVTPLLPTPTSRDHKGANQRGDETCLHGAISAYYGEGE